MTMKHTKKEENELEKLENEFEKLITPMIEESVNGDSDEFFDIIRKLSASKSQKKG